jgi:hypothetical protein
LPALSLQNAHGIVTDAIHGKYGAVGPADEAWQQCRTVLDPAIVIKSTAAGALHHDFELRDLVGATADIKHLGAPERRRVAIGIFHNPTIQLGLKQRQLAM